MHEHKKNTGYQRACEILRDTKVELNDKEENTWLEFKADAFIRDNMKKENESQGDYSWNIMKAALALANTCGGCILIGVDDKKNIIPLRCKKGEMNLDKYQRELDDILSMKEFKIKNAVTIKLKKHPQPQLQTEIKIVSTVGNEKIAAVLVEETENIFTIEKDGLTEVPYRAHGSYGKTKSLSLQDIQFYLENRPELSYCERYYSNFPLPKQDFVGRENLLEKVKGLFSGKNHKVVVIHAGPGIGKTEFAIRYADKYKWRYDAEICIHADGVHSIPEAFNKLYIDCLLNEKLHFERPDAISENELFDYFKRKLISDSVFQKILFVIDNAENAIFAAENIRKYLSGDGMDKLDILVTTRNNVSFVECDPGISIELERLSAEESLKLLEQKRKFASDDEKKAAEQIVKYLDGHAWSLDLLGENLKNRDIKYDNDYSEMLDDLKKTQILKFLQAENDVTIIHGCNDIKNLFLPILETMKPEQKKIAAYLVMFDPDWIFVDWIRDLLIDCMRQQDPEYVLKNKTWNELLHFFADNHILHHVDAEYCQMHRLTRRIIIETLPEEELRETVRQMEDFFTNKVRNNILSWLETQVIGYAVIQWGDPACKWGKNILSTLYSLSLENDLGDSLLYHKMFSLMHKVYMTSELVFQKLNDDKLKKKYEASYNIVLGHLAANTKEYNHAIDYFQKAIKIREKIFGYNAPETSLPIGYLGSVLGEIGKYEEAKQKITKADDIQRNFVGKISNQKLFFETIVRIRIRLAHVLWANGRFNEAYLVFAEIEENLEKISEILKKDDLLKAVYRAEYAQCLRSDNKMEAAEEMYRKAAEVYQHYGNQKEMNEMIKMAEKCRSAISGLPV